MGVISKQIGRKRRCIGKGIEPQTSELAGNIFPHIFLVCFQHENALSAAEMLRFSYIKISLRKICSFFIEKTEIEYFTQASSTPVKPFPAWRTHCTAQDIPNRLSLEAVLPCSASPSVSQSSRVSREESGSINPRNSHSSTRR